MTDVGVGVGVCFGGSSPEHDISILTGLQAVHALVEAGRDPHDGSRSACYGAPFTGSPAESTA